MAGYPSESHFLIPQELGVLTKDKDSSCAAPFLAAAGAYWL